MPPEPSSERLKRLLVLVPWVMARPGTPVAEVCRRFAIRPEQLAADLDLLFVCGLPPFGPSDLIEATIEEDRVVIDTADYLSRPPRLTRSEALALLIMGRAIASLPGLEEAEALRSALGKLSAAVMPAQAGETREVADRIAVELAGAGAELLHELREAIVERARLRIEYFAAGRGEMSEREIDPLLLFNAMGNWYVVALAVSDQRREERLFRVDRFRSLARTGQRFERPRGFDPARYENPVLFTPSERDVEIALDLAPDAAWIAETTPHEQSEELPDGGRRIRLRTPHVAWLVRLLLMAGPAARVRAPRELSESVRAAARRALDRYEESGSTDRRS